MNSSRQLKLGALISYFAIGFNVIIGLLFTPWMIHSLGRENYGLYTLAMSVISLFVFDFGLSSAVTRFVSKYLAEGRQDKADNCMGLVYRLYIYIDIVMMLVLSMVFFFIPHLYKELTVVEIERFKVVYVIAAIYSVISFPFIPLNGVLTAHEKFIQLKLCDVAHKLIVVLSMSVCLLLGGGLYSLVLVNASAGLVMILLKVICIKRYTSQSISWKYFDNSEFKNLIGFSGWVTIMSIAQRMIFNIAPSILGALSGSTSIAILGVAITLEGYTYTFANAINGMFLPRVSRIVASNNDELLPLMIKIGRIQLYIICLIVFCIICFGNHFICLWVGNDFQESYLCAVLVILPCLLQLPQDIGNQAILAKNKVKKLAIVYVIMAAVNIIISLLLVPLFGAVGICFSIFIAYMVRIIGMDYIFYRDLHIDIKSFFKETFVRLSIPMLVCLFSGLIINTIISSNTWLELLIKGICFVLIYTFVVYKFAMNTGEKELIISPVKKLIRR